MYWIPLRPSQLMNLPLLAELANMISAMVIGVPWLFWVTILLSGVLYVCGIVLRSTVSAEAVEMSRRPRLKTLNMYMW